MASDTLENEKRFSFLDSAQALTGGAAFLQQAEGDEYLLLEETLMIDAANAREDIISFFEFVMREENTQAPIAVIPHQRVGLEFIMAHERSVLMWPAGASKTFTMAGLTLWLLGRNPTLRGAVVSATQEQASKIVKKVRDYIENSEALKLVFPHLKQSDRRGDQWTQTALTVQRPYGIRDPSLVAVGIDGALAGARLNWIIVDDILSRENTATSEQRQKVCAYYDTTVRSRLDLNKAKIVVCNTPWHPDDLPHRLQNAGWATLRMGLSGDVWVKDDVARIEDGKEPWDSKGLRPKSANPADFCCRLTAHDPDPENQIGLWPEKFGPKEIRQLKRDFVPLSFNQLFECICRDDGTAMCKAEWIESCKARARAAGILTLTQQSEGRTYTGVDLAISPGEESDDCSFFTFEVLPGGFRKILDVDVGKFDGPTVVEKLFDLARRYNSIIRIENNAGQDLILQFARKRDVSLRIRPHTTGRTKAHPEYGVPGIFVELQNGAWLIPNDKHGTCHPNVQRWIDECLYYVPSRHTGDVLMSSWFAVEQARQFGDFVNTTDEDSGPSGGINLMIR